MYSTIHGICGHPLSQAIWPTAVSPLIFLELSWLQLLFLPSSAPQSVDFLQIVLLFLLQFELPVWYLSRLGFDGLVPSFPSPFSSSAPIVSAAASVQMV